MRGTAKFETMEPVKTDSKERGVPKNLEAQTNCGPSRTIREDPMRNILVKGLVDSSHKHGFVKNVIDEAEASIKE
jgi:hypothetical protein